MADIDRVPIGGLGPSWRGMSRIGRGNQRIGMEIASSIK